MRLTGAGVALTGNLNQPSCWFRSLFRTTTLSVHHRLLSSPLPLSPPSPFTSTPGRSPATGPITSINKTPGDINCQPQHESTPRGHNTTTTPADDNHRRRRHSPPPLSPPYRHHLLRTTTNDDDDDGLPEPPPVATTITENKARMRLMAGCQG
ncbi:hypothetical protein CPC08DRAFT_769032 [Agrocybe pediades]|nr:hypothetical protein CPC08DRAFT_769032 [Agrocybe pediades]